MQSITLNRAVVAPLRDALYSQLAVSQPRRRLSFAPPRSPLFFSTLKIVLGSLGIDSGAGTLGAGCPDGFVSWSAM